MCYTLSDFVHTGSYYSVIIVTGAQAEAPLLGRTGPQVAGGARITVVEGLAHQVKIRVIRDAAVLKRQDGRTGTLPSGYQRTGNSRRKWQSSKRILPVKERWIRGNRVS